MRKLILVVVTLTLIAIDAHAQENTVSADDVIAMIVESPVQLGHWRKAGFDKKPEAREIAEAIAAAADGSLLGNVREDAALMAVYAAYEGGMRKCVVGDGGKSWGTWQMQRASWKIACTPSLAIQEWLSRAQWSTKACERFPLEERLAQLASGSCEVARPLASRRVRVARKVALLASGMGE